MHRKPSVSWIFILLIPAMLSVLVVGVACSIDGDTWHDRWAQLLLMMAGALDWCIFYINVRAVMRHVEIYR